MMEQELLTDEEIIKALDDAPHIKENEGKFWECVAQGHKVIAQAQIAKLKSMGYVKWDEDKVAEQFHIQMVEFWECGKNWAKLSKNQKKEYLDVADQLKEILEES
jgi:hypothetical protein